MKISFSYYYDPDEDPIEIEKDIPFIPRIGETCFVCDEVLDKDSNEVECKIFNALCNLDNFGAIVTNVLHFIDFQNEKGYSIIVVLEPNDDGLDSIWKKYINRKPTEDEL